MKIVCISDTHGLHHLMKPLPEGDLLIHAGDITEYSTQDEVDQFISWFDKQPFTYKIFTGGNHDFALEHTAGGLVSGNNTFFLNNSSVEIYGLKIYGSPITPYSLDMAFNRRNGEELQAEWNKIPHDTDILITHVPPEGMLDNGGGCPYLADTLKNYHPKLHVFGHIHNGYGKVEAQATTYVNASLANEKDIMDMEYRLVNKPVVVNWE